MSIERTPTPAPFQAPLIELDDIVVQFGNTRVFDRFSLCVRKGQHLALTGPNGSGKSTLLRLMAADLRLSQIVPAGRKSNGRITWYFDGIKEASALIAKQHVRLVSPAMQGEYLRQEWRVTAEEVVLSGLENSPLLYYTPDNAERRKAHVLAREVSLSHLMLMEIPALSQGQLRAVLIMRAILAQPALLLLDEPFEGLDQDAREKLTRLMEQAVERGSTLVITAHRKEDVPGCIKEFVPLTETSGKALTLSAGLEEPLQLFEPALTAEDTVLPEHVLARHSQQVQEALPSNKPLLYLEHVDVYIERSQVLHDLHWQINKGEHWVVSGKNGAGKSTLLRLLYGEEFAAFGGTLQWFGINTPTIADLHALVGMVSDRLHQTYSYDISAQEVILSGFASTMGIFHSFSPSQKDIAQFWIDRLQIQPFASTAFHSLSTGQGRRVLLARALVNAPPLLLLDEALSGLDPHNRALWHEILPLIAQHGTQVVLVTHHSDDIPAFFTHELVLENGRLKRQGPRL